MTFVNPEPLAPFADVIAAGEGEVLVPALVAPSWPRPARATGCCDALASRARFLRAVARTTSEYGTDGHDRGVRRRGRDRRAGAGAQGRARGTTDAVDPPATRIFTPDTEFGSRLLIEVVRGCANLCRFCWAGYNYLPVRAFPADRILAIAEAARAHADRVRPGVDCPLRPPGHRAHPRAAWARWATRSARRRCAWTISPSRSCACCAQAASASITIAPETGSDRLRRVINKTFTNDEILDRADLIFASGIENLKLYFMIGLPTEDG